MRRLALDWTIAFLAASFLMMIPLSSWVHAEQDNFSIGSRRSTTLKENTKHKARAPSVEKIMSSEDHTYRLHSALADPKREATNPESGHSRQSSDTFQSHLSSGSPSQALPLTGSGEQRTPQFVFFQPVVVVRPNSLATLPCSVRNLGDRQVAWRMVTQDKFLTIGKMVWSSQDPRILVDYKQEEEDITTWDLVIKNVDSRDAGLYQCQVTSSEGIVMNVELKIEEPTTTTRPKMRVLKKVTNRDFRDTRNDAADEQRYPQKQEHFTAGMSIRLQCNTSIDNFPSEPELQMNWYKEGYPIKSNKHTLVTWHKRLADRTYVNELYINKSVREDSGQYHCKLNSEVLEAIMIYVLPNTTIGSEPKDRQSNPFSVGSLTTKDGASSLSAWHVSWMCTLAICILHLLFSPVSSHIYKIAALMTYTHDIRFIDET